LSDWVPVHTTYFRRDYGKLKKLNPEINKKTDAAITMILESYNPRRLGEHKINNMDCIYGYEIGLKYRILYEVLDEEREVVFYRLGLHNIYKQKLQRIRH
jgi:addiction module RelE/StbE family toxin